MVFNGAGKNLSELDVICHLTACAITQEMLDNTYPWALAWIDQHNTVHFRDANVQLEIERQHHLVQYREPVVGDDFRGWWSPDDGDMHRLCTLTYYKRYEYQPSGHIHTQVNQYWLLCGEDVLFTWLNEFPPSIPTPLPLEPDNAAPMSLDDDATVFNTNIAEATLNGATDDVNLDSDIPTPDLASDLNNTHITSRPRSA